MTNDFIIKNTVLEKYTGSASHVIIPEGITIENHLEEMLCDLIHAGHENIIQKMLDSGRLITRENIDFCIQTAIASQNHAVQLLLTNYKYQHFDFCNPADKLKL